MAVRVIGEGAQYRVLAHGTRVLKQPKTRQQMIAKVRTWKPKGNLDNTITSLVRLRAFGYAAARAGQIPADLIGHPQFLPHGCYKQDRVKILGDVLAQRSLMQQKTVINKLITFYLRQWRYGFSERVFNFTINNGLSKSGGITLVILVRLAFQRCMCGQRSRSVVGRRAGVSLRFRQLCRSSMCSKCVDVQRWLRWSACGGVLYSLTKSSI